MKTTDLYKLNDDTSEAQSLLQNLIDRILIPDALYAEDMITIPEENSADELWLMMKLSMQYQSKNKEIDKNGEDDEGVPSAWSMYSDPFDVCMWSSRPRVARERLAVCQST